MTALHHEIRIEAPLVRVWEAVGGDLTAVQRYNPLVVSSRLITAESHGVGATRHCDLKPSGFVQERVWHWDPPHDLGLEVAVSTWPVTFMKWSTHLAGDGDATVVTQDLSYRVKFGPIGKLLDVLLMRRKLDQSIDEVFAHLKRYLESGGS